jgi:hypothetical protein
METGLVVKLVEGKQVVRAKKGYRDLSMEEIEEVYGTPPIFENYEFPGAFGPNFHVFMTFFDIPRVAITLKAVELKE